jgi:hypothetical protein
VHLAELRNINLSLTTLGKVIQILAKGDHQSKRSSNNGHGSLYTPFRESKLTRLLQDSIGGNCKTYLIATISPTEECVEETISTLKFAERARQVVQQVKKNQISVKDDALIHKLQSEINYLKDLL